MVLCRSVDSRQVVYLETIHTEVVVVTIRRSRFIDPADPNVPPANGVLPIDGNQFVPHRLGPNGQIFTTLCDVFCNPGPSDQTVFVGNKPRLS